MTTAAFTNHPSTRALSILAAALRSARIANAERALATERQIAAYGVAGDGELVFELADDGGARELSMPTSVARTP